MQPKDAPVKPRLPPEALAAGFHHEASAWAESLDDISEAVQAQILPAMPDWQDFWFFCEACFRATPAA